MDTHSTNDDQWAVLADSLRKPSEAFCERFTAKLLLSHDGTHLENLHFSIPLQRIMRDTKFEPDLTRLRRSNRIDKHLNKLVSDHLCFAMLWDLALHIERKHHGALTTPPAWLITLFNDELDHLVATGAVKGVAKKQAVKYEAQSQESPVWGAW